MTKQYIKLGNGAILAIDDIKLIGRQELNEYAIVIDGVQGLTITADGNDVDAIAALLGSSLTVVEKKPEPVLKTRLEIAD